MSSELYHPDEIKAEKKIIYIVQTASGIVVMCSFS